MSRPTTIFIGRTEPVTRVHAAMSDHASPGCALTGVAGVGKSHLARHVVGLLEASGRPVVRVRATRSAATIPLGAFATIVPECGDGSQALQQARQTLLEMAGGERLVMMVDDAHLLDDASATLILEMASRSGVSCLVTCRSGEPCPEAVTALWDDLGIEVIDIRPFSRDEIEEFIRHILGEEVPSSMLDRLTDLSNGNPLALRELLRSPSEGGVLERNRDGWHLVSEAQLAPSLTDLAAATVAQFDERERNLIVSLSMCGPLPVALCEHLGTADSIKLLLARDLVEVTNDAGASVDDWLLGHRPTTTGDQVRLGHPLIGDAVRSTLNERQQRQILSRTADALCEMSDDENELMRSTLWRLWAGQELSADELIEAAQRQYRLGNYSHCGELARAAWETAPGFDAAYLTGFSLSRAGRPAPADEMWATAEGLAESDEQRVMAALARAENLFQGLGDANGATNICLAAERRITDPARRAEVTAYRASGAVQAGAVDAALATMEPLLDLATVGQRAFVTTAYPAGLALVHAGRNDDATRLARRALPIHEALWAEQVLQSEPGSHRLTLLFAAIGAGRYAEAAERLIAACEATRHVEPRYGHGWMRWFSGVLALRQGRCADAVEHCNVAIECFRQSGAFDLASWACMTAATASALRGDVSAADGYLEGTGEPAGAGLSGPMIAEARGWMAAASTDLDAAQRVFAETAHAALAGGDRLGAEVLFMALARCGDPTQAAEGLRELADGYQGELIELDLAIIEALGGAIDPDAIITVAERCLNRGITLEAAELYAVAMQRQRTSGQGRIARWTGTKGRSVLGRCQGARTPLTNSLFTAAPLTDRERAVSQLAAQRLTNREIAQRLNVSGRTVENHLHRVYQKLGISGRTELAKALGADELHG